MPKLVHKCGAFANSSDLLEDSHYPQFLGESGGCATADHLGDPGEVEMQSLNPAESVGEPPQVTDRILKDSSRALLNDEDNDILICTYSSHANELPPLPKLRRHIADEVVSCDSPSDLEEEEGSHDISTTQSANEEQTDSRTAWMWNELRYRSMETTSIRYPRTDEPNVSTARRLKSDHTLPVRTNSIEEFATDETISSASSASGNEDFDEGEASIFSFKKQNLLQSLMKTFYTQLSPFWRHFAKGSVTSVGAGGSNRSSSSSAGQKATTQSQGKTEKPTLKRCSDNKGVPPGDGEDGDGARKKSFKSPLDPQSHDNARKYACPFFKYDPKIYSKFGSCIGPGFTSVSRVKFVPLIITAEEVPASNLST
jgi:hypothetical protein